jgi:hypothetical protein
MGAWLDEGYGMGRTMLRAWDACHEQKVYDHGHAGYSGTLAEKGAAVSCGRVPPRLTADDWDRLAENYDDWKRQGYWMDSVPDGEDEYGNPKRRSVKRRRDPRPKSLRTTAYDVMLRKWWQYRDGDKWDPCAAIRLNVKEEREFKRRNGRAGTRDQVWYFAGNCSS